MVSARPAGRDPGPRSPPRPAPPTRARPPALQLPGLPGSVQPGQSRRAAPGSEPAAPPPPAPAPRLRDRPRVPLPLLQGPGSRAPSPHAPSARGPPPPHPPEPLPEAGSRAQNSSAFPTREDSEPHLPGKPRRLSSGCCGAKKLGPQPGRPVEPGRRGGAPAPTALGPGDLAANTPPPLPRRCHLGPGAPALPPVLAPRAPVSKNHSGTLGSWSIDIQPLFFFWGGGGPRSLWGPQPRNFLKPRDRHRVRPPRPQQPETPARRSHSTSGSQPRLPMRIT